MTTVTTNPAPAIPSRTRLRYRRLLACLLVASMLNAGIVAATAVWLPFARPYVNMAGSGDGPVEYVKAFIRNAQTRRELLTRWTSGHERVEVATWGDHLQPWHIRITTPFATRLTWFEKGRVYNRADAVAPSGASSAAVSCWSFATACWSATGSRLTGPLPAPPELTESNQQRRTWATAIEERGWPFRAFTCRLSAPLGDAQAPVYSVDGGVWADGDEVPASGGEIQTLRAIPCRPLWPGLIANTLLFTAALYTLSFVPPIVTRRFRSKRGHCPRCNYNLRGQPAPGCPECGWKRATPPAPHGPTTPP